MAKFIIQKGFIFQKTNKGISIFDSEESMLFNLNETASYIFQKLKSGWTETKITEAMIKRYKIRKEASHKDVKEFISDLKKHKIISSVKTKLLST